MQYTQEQYEQHFQQLEKIKLEIEAQDKDIISEKLEMQLLEAEYFDNTGFLLKIQEVKKQFPYFRRVRRDGSCFYRAFLFKIVEEIISKKNSKLLNQIKSFLKQSKEDLKKIGYDDSIIDDFQEQPLNIKLDLCPDKMTIDEAKNAFCDKLKSDYMIMYMRMLTTCYIKTNPFMFEAYIEGDSIDKFCQSEIDPIDREADQIQIMALINYINIGIRIHYLDGNINNKQPTIFQIPEDEDPNKIFINLLYRPGHYDILYHQL